MEDGESYTLEDGWLILKKDGCPSRIRIRETAIVSIYEGGE